ncbi:MAG: glycosyltransferase family 9 protein [Candidatus Poribacteria bacterium]
MNVKNFLRTIEEYTTLILSYIVGQICYRNRKINYPDINRIAIIKLDHLGDVILSTPAIANIREYFQNAHITLVVNSLSKAIAEIIPYVDEILLYNARFFDRSGDARAFNILKGVKFAVNMRHQKFDLIIDFRGSIATILYAIISNSKYRLDRGTYLVKKKFRKNKSPLIPLSQRRNVEKSLLQKRQGIYKGDEWTDLHEANVCLNILAEAGIPVKIKKTSIDPKCILQNFDNNGSDTNIKIVIHAGAPMLLKRWSSQKYVDLIKMLLQDYPAKIFLIGGKDEYELSNKILTAIDDEHIINLAGKLTLSELACLLKKSHLFIGNDSGPMHIASACGTKVIGLYGPTDPERFGPYGSNCVALRMEDRCPPCAKDKCKFKDYRCIDQISVEDVMNVVKNLVNIYDPFLIKGESQFPL